MTRDEAMSLRQRATQEAWVILLADGDDERGVFILGPDGSTKGWLIHGPLRQVRYPIIPISYWSRMAVYQTGLVVCTTPDDRQGLPGVSAILDAAIDGGYTVTRE